MALDEELEYSSLGMLFGFDYNAVNVGLQRLRIPVRSWNALKSLMDQPDIFSASVQAQALNVLDDIFKYGMEEKDDGALMYGFLLLKYLSEKNNYFLLNPYGKVRYTNVGWLCQAYRSLSTSKDHTDKPIRLIILEILTHIHLEIDSCETICRELIPYKFKNDQFSLSELLYLSRLGQRIIQTFLDYAENIPLHLLDSYVKRLADSFEMICTLHKGPIDDLVFEEVLLTTLQIMRHCECDHIWHSLFSNSI